MGNFVVKEITNIKEIKKGDIIPESDYSLYRGDDQFVQFEYVNEEEEEEEVIVKPGLWAVEKSMQGLYLKKTGFIQERILEDYIYTESICEKINKFFEKIDVYKRRGRFPKRGMLLYGPPGTGKSLILSKLAEEYKTRNDTAVVIWHTDKFEAHSIKSFIGSFKYTEEVKHLLLIAEDIGGIEFEGAGKMRSDSSLLSLLDNVEKTFTIPTMILATTNYPENFLENLVDRPQRFDHVEEVKRPVAEFRAKFLQFFAEGEEEYGLSISEEDLNEIKKKTYEHFSIAHIQEIIDRVLLYDLTVIEAIKQLQKQSKKAKNQFENPNDGVGF